MKSVLKLMAGVAVIVSLHSVAQAKDLVVGVSWSNFQEERWKTDEAAIKAALEASGDKYISADAQSSAAKQLTDVESLIAQGAIDVYAYITHGVLSGGAVARITGSRLKELVITDSIQPTQAVRVAHNIRVLSVATLIGEAIGRTAAEESVSSLFDD